MASEQVREAIESTRVVGILRSAEPADLLAVCRALVDGGLSVLEITLNTPGATDAIRSVRAQLGSTITLGAGTILSPTDARSAIDAGAQFIVTPTLQPDTIALCRERGVPILCGAMTPSEIFAAHCAGADYIKLFPAGSLGLDFVKAVLAPMPFLKIVPTGGVSLDNIADFLKLCPAVAIGSNLANPRLIAEGKWDELKALARQFADAGRKTP